jgi:hypothetical protein
VSLAIRTVHARRVAALTVLALVAAQIGAFAHESETRHRWCAEHQVAEDLQVAHDHDGATHHAAGALTAVETRAVHDHEACAVSTASLGGTEARSYAPAPQLLDVQPEAHAPPVTAARPTPGLFRLAPKTSPPTA